MLDSLFGRRLPPVPGSVLPSVVSALGSYLVKSCTAKPWNAGRMTCIIPCHGLNKFWNFSTNTRPTVAFKFLKYVSIRSVVHNLPKNQSMTKNDMPF